MAAPQRTARIEDDIWDPAQTRAKAEGASLGALMRAAVQRYATGDLTSNAEPASQPHPSLTSHAQGASQAPRRPSPLPGRASRALASSAWAPGAGSVTTASTACAHCPCAPHAPPPSRAAPTSGRSRRAPPGSPAAAQPDETAAQEQRLDLRKRHAVIVHQHPQHHHEHHPEDHPPDQTPLGVTDPPPDSSAAPPPGPRPGQETRPHSRCSRATMQAAAWTPAPKEPASARHDSPSSSGQAQARQPRRVSSRGRADLLKRRA